MTDDIARNSRGETPEEELARIEASIQPTERQIARHAERRAYDASKAEERESSASGEGAIADISTQSMRGLGPDGPEFIYIPFDEEAIGKDGSKLKDDWGETLYIKNHLRKRLSEFVLGDLAEVGYLLSHVDQSIIRIAIAWSFQRGEGDLDPHVAAKWIDRALPGEIEVSDDEGDRVITRDKVTAEQVLAALYGKISTDMGGSEYVANLVDVIVYALRVKHPDINAQWVMDRFSHGLLVKALAKIFFLNGGMRDRFFEPLVADEAT